MESENFIQPDKDLDKIHELVDSRLKNEKLIEIPQKPECEIVVAVPVHNESVKRIFEQVKSLMNQTYEPDKYEVIYIINNGSAEEQENDEGYKRIIETNKKILDLPLWKNSNSDNIAFSPLEEQDFIKNAREKLNLFVVDKSTLGNEITNCNVGRARNRVLAEATQRFLNNNKNGIILHTDADSIFNNPNHLEIVDKTFKDDPSAIAIAGGVKYILSLDDSRHEKAPEIEKHLLKAELLKRIKIIANYLNDSSEKFADSNTRFSGSHMIAKGYESALIGGFDDANKAEDVNFGKDLENYAAKNNKHVLGMRGSLSLSTALRESKRTGSSFGHYLKDDFSYEETLVDYPFPHISKMEFKEKILSWVKTGEIKNTEKLKELFTDTDNKLIIKESAIIEIQNILQNNDIKDVHNPLISDWLMNNLGVIKDWTSILYQKKYPKVVANKYLYNKLLLEINKKQGGADLIRNLDASFGKIDD